MINWLKSRKILKVLQTFQRSDPCPSRDQFPEESQVAGHVWRGHAHRSRKSEIKFQEYCISQGE
jgi:hypothetical protein